MKTSTDLLVSPTILVVDDDPTQRTMLEAWLGHSGYTPLMASDGLEAVSLIREHTVDVVVTDLRMPQIDGLQLLTILGELHPDVPVIFLTGNSTVEDAVRALRGGRAFDFLLKPLRHLRELNSAIEAALMRRQEARTAAGGARTPTMEGTGEPLTETELKLVDLLAQGCDNKRIAATLHFSEKTVRNYLSRLYDKLGVNTRLRAVAACRERGWID